MNPFDDVKLDANGRVIPTAEAILKVEREYAAKTEAEQHRLAQAQTLIDAFQRRVRNR